MMMPSASFARRTLFTYAFLLLCLFAGLSGAHAARAAEGPNLVPNASLETQSGSAPASWTAGRWGTNAAVFRYPVSGVEAGSAAEVQLTSRASGDAKWYFNEVPISGGATYTYADQYESNIDTYVTVQYRLSDGTNSWVDLVTPAAAANWSMVQTTFTAPANATAATVFHLINAVGVLRIDDISLRQELPDSNLVPNPSLENQTGSAPSSWAAGRWGANTAIFRYPVAGIDGARAAEVELTQRTSGDAKWYFNEVPISGATTYTFSDQYQSSIGSHVTAQYRLSDGSYAWIDIGAPATSSTWASFQKTFTTPSNAVAVTVFHLINAVGVLRVDAFSLKQGSGDATGTFSEGFVSLNFDDGWKTTYQNAIPILDAAGFKSTQYIITGRFSFSGYVNQTETVDMYHRGHEIGAHTRTHPDLTTLSDADKRTEIAGSRQDLLDLGIMPVSTFAFPFGAYDASTTAIVQQSGFAGARTSDGGFNAKNGNSYQLKREPVESGTTLTQIETWVQQARAQKLWLILVFHHVDASGESTAITPALFQQIVDYLKTNGVPVRTTSQGLQLMAS